MHTPWGPSDHQQKLADGIVFYGTPSHGGIHLSPDRLRDMPEAFRALGEGSGGAFFEEDCAYALVFLGFPEEFTRDEVARAHKTVKSWFPDEYEDWCGHQVTADESYIVAQHEFAAAHADEFVSIAAWGEHHKDVPAGMVGVVATLGGQRGDGYSSPEKRYFLVTKDEYDQREGGEGIVIDLERHQAWVTDEDRSTKAVR